MGLLLGMLIDICHSTYGRFDEYIFFYEVAGWKPNMYLNNSVTTSLHLRLDIFHEHTVIHV